MGAPKNDDDLLDVSPKKLPTDCSGTRLTDRISNSRLYKKCGLIPLSRAIMREGLR
jgi:hypothetical protein